MSKQILDVSNQEQIISHDEQTPSLKRPIYIRTLNVFINPIRHRYDRHYREKKHHLIIDMLFLVIIILLIIMNLILYLKSFNANGQTINNQQMDKQQISAPYFNINFYVNKTGTLPANLGDELEYILNFKNITSERMSDVVIEVNLSGAAIDLGTLKTNGNYEDGIIKWTKTENESLALIESGQEINLEFRFKVKESIEINNPVIASQAHITAFVLDKKIIQSTDKMHVKVNSDLKVKVSYKYFTKEGEQLGIGAWPPKVGETTSVRIFLDVENNLNKVKNAIVTSALPDNVKWTGSSVVNNGQPITFDQPTRQIIWPVGEINTLGGSQANFEVEFTPQADNLNKPIKLLENIKISGQDLFSSARVGFKAGELMVSEMVE